ncbi:Protein of unknown function [Clostridium cavendishii DSM 21758]|uniref:DUF2628 domain-containing protein n=1 Tax=Clostridium cavendishii DSM 21758 TaxID=1121302 RepID=A0A1M6EYA0_9CLOT|nr:DUF2628 domain-containing protein [Clostridium cavendishii]SHI90371.1 Protein of unknown function [Clostridium cavendishii DSM 21758]
MENNFNNDLPYTLEEYNDFIGQEKAGYYTEKFKLANRGNKASWNWPAFFFSAIWLMYRKMYAIGAGIFVCNLVLVSIHRVLGLVLNIVVAIFANYLYSQHVNTKIAQIKALGLSKAEEKMKLVNQGGVNIVIPIVFAVIYVLIIVLLVLVFATLFTFATK